MGTALSKYGAARLLAGEIDASVSILDEAVAFTRDTPPDDITRIFALFWRGWAAYARGDIDTAAALVERVLAIGREFRLPTTTGHALTVCAQIALTRGNVEDACLLVAEALEIESSNEDGFGIAFALDVVTLIAGRRGRMDDAARFAGAVDAHHKRIAIGLPRLAPREHDALFATLRSALGADFDALYAEGSAWSAEQTIAAAFAETSRHTAERTVPQRKQRDRGKEQRRDCREEQRRQRSTSRGEKHEERGETHGAIPSGWSCRDPCVGHVYFRYVSTPTTHGNGTHCSSDIHRRTERAPRGGGLPVRHRSELRSGGLDVRDARVHAS